MVPEVTIGSDAAKLAIPRRLRNRLRPAQQDVRGRRGRSGPDRQGSSGGMGWRSGPLPLWGEGRLNNTSIETWGARLPTMTVRQGHCGHCADTAFSQRNVMTLSV